ncbi:MAG: hypothetical protein SRB2_03244 [Desulfobacteraceae bacterium Eth-SRB2]|nr:MAG: hypothetical protein SRB2_03244 [Desulfobacteraceae bacterium Eth-SRB2]
MTYGKICRDIHLPTRSSAKLSISHVPGEGVGNRLWKPQTGLFARNDRDIEIQEDIKQRIFMFFPLCLKSERRPEP